MERRHAGRQRHRRTVRHRRAGQQCELSLSRPHASGRRHADAGQQFGLSALHQRWRTPAPWRHRHAVHRRQRRVHLHECRLQRRRAAVRRHRCARRDRRRRPALPAHRQHRRQPAVRHAEHRRRRHADTGFRQRVGHRHCTAHRQRYRAPEQWRRHRRCRHTHHRQQSGLARRLDEQRGRHHRAGGRHLDRQHFGLQISGTTGRADRQHDPGQQQRLLPSDPQRRPAASGRRQPSGHLDRQRHDLSRRRHQRRGAVRRRRIGHHRGRRHRAHAAVGRQPGQHAGRPLHLRWRGRSAHAVGAVHHRGGHHLHRQRPAPPERCHAGSASHHRIRLTAGFRQRRDHRQRQCAAVRRQPLEQRQPDRHRHRDRVRPAADREQQRLQVSEPTTGGGWRARLRQLDRLLPAAEQRRRAALGRDRGAADHDQ